jgi:mRNA interferase MazF
VFPFTDLTWTKRRPAIVVSPDNFNCRNEDLVLVALTSQVNQIGPAVLIQRGDVEAGLLPKDSIARLAKLFTLHSSLVTKQICRLTATKKDELLSKLRAFF